MAHFFAWTFKGMAAGIVLALCTTSAFAQYRIQPGDVL
jgi:hypothetical protein